MPVKGWIQVDSKYCKGCELCVSACPQEVIALDQDKLTAKGYHPAVLAHEGCTGCGICALVCPDVAIEVYREVSRVPHLAAAEV
jgi:2-oxoglutarate ferredoxin oxidoreductase subunit delta